ncbi:MAG: 4Fe-4S binding protein [Firmicutes bacterium]|jgi:pyruvate ferredoxin oxidoreductase delta subunit|nr:4Fe-4S binding protein [Bacillota bacterium]
MLKRQGAVSPASKFGRNKEGPVAFILANANTGTWRLKRPVPQNEHCNRCGLCAQYCPCGVLTIEDCGCRIDYYYCKGCGICAEMCPQKDIKIITEPTEEEKNIDS